MNVNFFPKASLGRSEMDPSWIDLILGAVSGHTSELHRLEIESESECERLKAN